jgi:hypothetical protein
MTIGRPGNNPAPTPLHPREFTLFFIPASRLPDVESFFAGLDEPDEHFLLVPAMRVDQLAWRPDRIKRGDVRSITDQRGGAWVALAKPHQVAQLRMILENGKG